MDVIYDDDEGDYDGLVDLSDSGRLMGSYDGEHDDDLHDDEDADADDDDTFGGGLASLGPLSATRGLQYPRSSLYDGSADASQHQQPQRDEEELDSDYEYFEAPAPTTNSNSGGGGAIFAPGDAADNDDDELEHMLAVAAQRELATKQSLDAAKRRLRQQHLQTQRTSGRQPQASQASSSPPAAPAPTAPTARGGGGGGGGGGAASSTRRRRESVDDVLARMDALLAQTSTTLARRTAGRSSSPPAETTPTPATLRTSPSTSSMPPHPALLDAAARAEPAALKLVLGEIGLLVARAKAPAPSSSSSTKGARRQPVQPARRVPIAHSKSPLELAQRMLDARSPRDNGGTALMLAVVAEANAQDYLEGEAAVECVRLLLEAGASTEVPDDRGQTALMWAARLGACGSTRLLVRAGAALQPAAVDMPAAGGPAAGGLAARSALHLAVESRSAETLASLLLSPRSSERLNQPDPKNGQTPLLAAARLGQESMVAMLLRKGANALLATPDDQRTALHYAVANGDHAVARLLLAHNAKTALQRDCFGRQPLHLAAALGDLKCLAQLLETPGLQLDAADALGRAPTHWAVVCNRGPALFRLLQAGADPNPADHHRARPLHYAAQQNSLGCLEVLLQFEQLALNCQDEAERTPLVWAIIHSHEAFAAALLDAVSAAGVPTDLHQPDAQGFTPLHYAVHVGLRPTVELLLARGADARACDANGQTPLFRAAIAGHRDCAELLLHAIEGEGEGDAHPASDSPPSAGVADYLQARDSDGRTPLHWAAASNAVDVIALLLARGGPRLLQLRDENGTTAMHEAALQGSPQLLASLAVAGGDVNAADSQGVRPLHCAALEGHTAACQRLVQLGARINAADDKAGGGMTPLDFANTNRHHQCAQRLLSLGAVTWQEVQAAAARYIQAAWRLFVAARRGTDSSAAHALAERLATARRAFQVLHQPRLQQAVFALLERENRRRQRRADREKLQSLAGSSASLGGGGQTKKTKKRGTTPDTPTDKPRQRTGLLPRLTGSTLRSSSRRQQQPASTTTASQQRLVSLPDISRRSGRMGGSGLTRRRKPEWNTSTVGAEQPLARRPQPVEVAASRRPVNHDIEAPGMDMTLVSARGLRGNVGGTSAPRTGGGPRQATAAYRHRRANVALINMQTPQPKLHLGRRRKRKDRAEAAPAAPPTAQEQARALQAQMAELKQALQAAQAQGKPTKALKQQIRRALEDAIRLRGAAQMLRDDAARAKTAEASDDTGGGQAAALILHA